MIQTLFRARSMKVTYRDSRGASASVSLSGSELPGTLKSGTSSASNGVEEYADVILGYKALFVAGGEGSSMTDATARQLADASQKKGYKATTIGNLVLVEVTGRTAPQLSQLTQAAVARDKIAASHRPSDEESIKRRQIQVEALKRREAEIVNGIPRKADVSVR